MAKLAMSTTLPLNCAVQWCTIEADEHDTSTHVNIDAAPIEVLDLVTGRPSVVGVDIEQHADDIEPRIVLNGPGIDRSFLAGDARRIALAMLAQVALAEA